MTATRPAPDFAAARRAMLDSQLRTSGVNEPFVLARMGEVAREDFVPETMRSAAYMDRAIALGDGRHLAAPLVQGRMLAEAKPVATDTALVVDGGSGYLAELLRPLVGSLTVQNAEEAIKGRKGGFSLIVVDGAAEEIPTSLARRMADDGRIVTGLAERGVTRLAVGRKIGGELSLLPVADIGMPVLAEFAAPKGWSF
ncbi:MAG: protein-L-isoaspartate O-methyltransferase [Sphingomonadaceae bacterium]